MNDLESQVSKIKSRWMTGAAAADVVPQAWSGVLEQGSDNGIDPELSLVALTGQLLQVAFRPVNDQILKPLAPLPELSLPLLADPLRPIFRRLISSFNARDGGVNLLTLMAHRGVAANPLDWLPSARAESLPAVYAPWVNWVNGLAADDRARSVILDSENWADFMPGERRDLLRLMRVESPAVARALIEDKVPAEGAEERNKIIAVLGQNLTENDKPFLEHLLASDRSGKVKISARNLLARLGQFQAADESTSELADFLTVNKKGVLKKEAVVSASKTKNNAQRKRRRELFELVSFDALASALNLQPLELARGWLIDDRDGVSDLFVTLIVESGADEVIWPFTQNVLNHTHVQFIPDELLERVRQLQNPEITEKLKSVVLAADDGYFDATARCLKGAPGSVDMNALENTAGLKDLLKDARDYLSDANEKRALEHKLEMGLANLAVISTQEAAGALLERFIAAGMMTVDPKLEYLRFNAALDRSEPKSV